jgi:RNA polymerase sigma-32 factor
VVERAAIQEYILHSWYACENWHHRRQKKLFFNLRRLKRDSAAPAMDDGDLSPEQVSHIAKNLVVDEGRRYFDEPTFGRRATSR